MYSNSNGKSWLKLLFALSGLLPGSAPAQESAATEFYVAPNGADTQDGSIAHPFLTLPRARDAVRAINRGMKHDITVYLRGGSYPLTAPIEFTPADSGFNGFHVIYTACNNEIPVISGGITVSGWTLDQGHIYKATLKRDVKLRSLYVNGIRAEVTARSFTGRGAWGEFVIQGKEPWAETPGKTWDGIAFDPKQVPALTNPSDLELFQARVFSFPVMDVRDLTEENGSRVLKLQQPDGAIAATMAWGCGVDPKGNFTLRNAYEFLGKPGQFYFNRLTHTLYYFAHEGEDLNRETVIAPQSEGLLRITGSSVRDRVTHLVFTGLTFSFDHWLLQPVGDSRGVVGVQSLGLYTKFRADGNHHKSHYDILDLPQGTVELRNCADIRFERNHFEHLGSGSAVSLVNDVMDSSIIGNVFNDISGNAINVGHPQHYIIGDGPLYPAGIEGVCARDTISNNRIRKVCLEFEQFEAISGFFTEALHISHNDIAGVPYGGIALGWWWGDANIPPSTVSRDNVISCNKIFHTQQKLAGDGGALYVLGQQPGGQIEGNYIHSPTRLIYPDNGSSGWSISKNVLDTDYGSWIIIWSERCHDMKIDGNYTNTGQANNHGTNTPLLNTQVEKGSWSPEAQAIIDAAGLEPAYKDIGAPSQ